MWRVADWRETLDELLTRFGMRFACDEFNVGIACGRAPRLVAAQTIAQINRRIFEIAEQQNLLTLERAREFGFERAKFRVLSRFAACRAAHDVNPRK